MRYAQTADKKRVEATRGIEIDCFCEVCGKPVIAKCGDIRNWHWAHKSGEACDTWQSPMTEWHRNWQDKFPEEWREYPLRKKKSQECHIADIFGPKVKDAWLAIEFQHSAINPEERTARENFYNHMVWVVDGNRTKTAYSRIQKIDDYLQPIGRNFYLATAPEEYLPQTWLGCRVPVFFDFKELPFLLCVFPVNLLNKMCVTLIDRDYFIGMAISGNLRKMLEENLEILKTFKVELENSMLQSLKSVSALKATSLKRHHTRKEARRHGPHHISK